MYVSYLLVTRNINKSGKFECANIILFMSTEYNNIYV